MVWCACAPPSSNIKSVDQFLQSWKPPQLTLFRYACICLHEEAFVRWFKAILSVRQPISLFCEFLLIDNGSANWSLQSPVVTICTASLTFNNSTFCLHSVFMCFVWIWEQTAIISLYSTDGLVFITETECVYCAVRSTFYVLPTQCVCVLCGSQNKQRLFHCTALNIWFV